MSGDTAFLVDDFLQALVAQLDKTQDALAFKAVNRPLTYAIKDFNLQLQVFVDLDSEGNVRLRSAGPNEAGASTMTIALTTITRPMIEENTVSLAATRAPSLADAGFDPAERRKLQVLGVTNTAQLQRLGTSTGASVMARLTEIPVDRLRSALRASQPTLTSVSPIAHHPAMPIGHDGGGPVVGPAVGPAPGPDLVAAPFMPSRSPVIHLSPNSSHLVLGGSGLAGGEGPTEIRIDGKPVAASEADWDRLTVPLPAGLRAGTLEVTLSDGSTSRYSLQRHGDAEDGNDPWRRGVE